MLEHSHNPNKINDSNKDSIVEIIAEEFGFNLLLVGIWHGENELASFTVPYEVWKDENQILEIVNSILLNSGKDVVKWL